MMNHTTVHKIRLLVFLLAVLLMSFSAQALYFSESSYLIAEAGPQHVEKHGFWNYLSGNPNSGVEISLTENNDEIRITGSSFNADQLLERLYQMLQADSSRIIPVFLRYEGRISLLDSVINESVIAPHLFFLPRGEAWPSIDYLIQSGRRIIIFLTGDALPQSRMFHKTSDYALIITATGVHSTPLTPNLELLIVRDFEKLPVSNPPGSNIRNLVPNYINYLLETWTRYGKRPNFIFVNNEIRNFDFIISQLNSFTWFNGIVRGSGKTFERVFWKNPEVVVTGGHFSFPYRGGEELTLTPFVPGFQMTPEHIIVTGEMEVPESYNIMATPLNINEGLTASFRFDNSIVNLLDKDSEYRGENYSFTQDIERGTVLRLPENSNINLNAPENYGLRNNSFTVSCFVKFSEIMEYGDNAIIGNYESEYRRGLHLILRSGHPYFGLWANDYISDEKLESNMWYHIVWRYIIETGEQAIFLNGNNIGSSVGHPPFLGTGDIYLGSALSQGANLRGYIDDLNIWQRPLGVEEITRLSLNEQVRPQEPEKVTASTQFTHPQIIMAVVSLLLLTGVAVFWFRKKKVVVNEEAAALPHMPASNQILLFGGFRATDLEGNDVTGLFTPKIKELLLFILLETLNNNSGAAISDIDEQLWPGTDARKVSNNRAVTLNKLRKVLQRFSGLEIITLDGMLQARTSASFFCDFTEAYTLCHTPGGMTKAGLELFFSLVSKGRFLKGTTWEWADGMKGYITNQVIDNLLKLAVIYYQEKKLNKVESIARLILEFDDLNEEATWLFIRNMQLKNNSHQARYYFDAFCSRYRDAMGEDYPVSYDAFKKQYAGLLSGTPASEKYTL